jgi:hypothetical protein
LSQAPTKDRGKDNAWQKHKLLGIYTSTPHLQIIDEPERSYVWKTKSGNVILTNKIMTKNKNRR